MILERADAIGGTWRDNTYPNVAVDIPSLTYQFSYEMNPNWSRLFAPGAEVWDYAEHCVDKYGLREHLRLGTEVRDATYDEAERAVAAARRPARDHHPLLDLRASARSPSRRRPTSRASTRSGARPSTPPAGTTTSISRAGASA